MVTELNQGTIGVYRFIDSTDKIIYVGKSVDINKRIHAHWSPACHLPKKCYEETQMIEYCDIGNESDTEMYETYYINKFKPFYNTDKVYKDTPTIILPEPHWKRINKAEIRHNIKTEVSDIITYLEENESYVWLSLKDRTELINTINARSDGKLLKSLKSLNDELEKKDIQFRIKEFYTSRYDRRSKKNKSYNHAWKLIKC